MLFAGLMFVARHIRNRVSVSKFCSIFSWKVVNKYETEKCSYFATTKKKRK
jgi:hypothetical protein